MKLEISTDTLKKLLKTLAGLGPFLALLVMIGAIGFCGWRASQSLNVLPSNEAIEAARSAQSVAKTKFDTKVINSVNTLVDVPTTIDTSTVGKTNPFAP